MLSRTKVFSLCQFVALFANVNSFISVLLLGHIGSHMNITSGRRGHQAKLGRVRDYPSGT